MVIIAAIDRSDRVSSVLEEAEVLAEAFDETLHVVHAISRSEFIDLEQMAYEEEGKSLSMEEIRSFATDYAERAAEGVTIEYKPIGLVGQPANEIITYSTKIDTRYIVVAPRRRSPTGKALFGSVAQSVILNVDCPVVTTVSQPYQTD
ncbi:universal stress protein [Halostagnicola bangensis]